MTRSYLRASVWLVTLGAVCGARAGTFGRENSVKVRVTKPGAIARLLSRGGQIVADYGHFTLVEMPASAMDADDDAEVLPYENHILLNSGPVDTRQREARQLQRPRGLFAGKSMHLVQFAGPVQPAWLDELTKTGVQIVSYIPNNTYLVYGNATQVAAVQGLSGRPQIQWDAPYQTSHKIHPRALVPRNAKDPAPPATGLYAIQLVDDPAANNATLTVLNNLKSAPVRGPMHVLNYINVIVNLPAGKVADVASQPDVVSIAPYAPRKLFDESQDQIIAGNLTGSGPSAPGYLAWLASKGFTQAQFTASGFAVDVTDSGLDNGTTSPNHFGLYVDGTRPGTSRVVYNRLEGTPNGGSTIKGCDGHGTLNSHIIAGFSDLTGFPYQDASGYQYGLGVAPFVKVGSSVIFDPNTYTDPNFANLQSKAYHDNARISSNSWGGDNFGGYDVDAQAYDALVRDAQPTGSTFANAGNQEMVIVFANGNAGSGAGTVGTPATAKNVISVGAGENVRSFGGSDGSGVSDSGANSANDIISFSSRGPCADGRKKPDIVAPGTHVTGGVAQVASPASTGTADACYNAGGVSGGVSHASFFPSGQQFYTASSGTSHSTPAVAGGCALIRQFFLNMGMQAPSPAMTKALLINSARYMTGANANDTLWSNNQGMGEMNLGEAFNRGAVTPTFFRDQFAPDLFTSTGQSRVFAGVVADPSKPLRVTLAWTDAPGPTSGAAYRNDLDLTVTVGGNTYKGNVFTGQNSVTGGSADPQNNVESVFLPVGVNGTVAVTINASSINSDGVPNVGGALDQDFALVAYNVSVAPAPVIVAAGSAITSESCLPPNGAIDPGETVTIDFSLINVGTADASDVSASLQPSATVGSPSGPQNYGTLVAGGPAVARSFTFTAGGTCGSTLTATLQVQPDVAPTFQFTLGATASVFAQNFDGVAAPALPAGWVATVAQGSVTAWATSTSQRDTVPNAAFAADPSTVTDNRLTSPAIAVATSSAQLTFRHSYNLEISSTPTTAFDAGVLEISIAAGAFTDIITAGGTFVSGGYSTTVSNGFSNPLAGRSAWSGNSGGFTTTTVKLPAAAAGQNIQLRWRLGTDNSVSATGWYVDSISITEPVCCVPSVPCNVPFADADADGDVDQTDYAAWQLCAGTYTPGACACFDRDGNGQIDSADLPLFLQCMSGANIPADPGCAGP